MIKMLGPSRSKIRPALEERLAKQGAIGKRWRFIRLFIDSLLVWHAQVQDVVAIVTLLIVAAELNLFCR